MRYTNRKGVKRIHVNQHHIRANLKDDENRPVFTCKVGTQNLYGHEVQIHGESTLVYSNKPLNCGARCWIETVSPITITEDDHKTEVE